MPIRVNLDVVLAQRSTPKTITDLDAQARTSVDSAKRVLLNLAPAG
jgi:hypothetical protein